jgi:hypothetical protein
MYLGEWMKSIGQQPIGNNRKPSAERHIIRLAGQPTRQPLEWQNLDYKRATRYAFDTKM